MSHAPAYPSLRQLVLKIHSRCDLLCDHCYVYEHADQSWRSRPVFIRPDTVRSVAARFAEYAASRALESVSVILHGGEPLLVGPTRLRDICGELVRTLSPLTSLDLRMHTNAVTLNRHHLEVCREFGVRVSVSLDGDRRANDRHRLDRRGHSSYDRVMRGIRLLRQPEYRDLFSGLLCTVDVANDPVAVHDALTALEPPRIDYLLPHSTWDSPPPNPSGAGTPYADWLLAVFDRWEQQGRPMPVRTFDSVLSTLRGGPSLTEALGLAPSDLAVIETDGSFEQADWLKTAYAGAPETGYDVFRHGFAEFAEHPGVRARQLGVDGISDTCRRCPVMRSCGGGLYGHRYSSERGFDNPSVFCTDLRSLVEGIADRVTDSSMSPAVLGVSQLLSSLRELDAVLLSRAQVHLAHEPGWADAWKLIVTVDEDPGTAPFLDEILAHPYVRTSLQRALQGCAESARFMALAVATALRAGMSATLGWDQPGIHLHLPTLGTYLLDAPGRIEVTVAPARFRVRSDEDPGGTWVRLAEAADAPRWRPLTRLRVPNGPLVDDADPYRDCYPASVALALEGDAFTERLTQAYELLERADRHGGPHAFRPTVLTPLEAGSGLLLGDHGFGALGVAVDVEPAEFARQLPHIGRRARLAALRATADLYRLGSPAGELLDRVDEGLRQEAYDEAARALTALTLLPERELTATGVVLVAQMWSQWAVGHG